MKTFAICVLLLASISADAAEKVAFLEFQNKAGTIITTNRWTMAEDLAKRVKKTHKNIQIVSRKEILKNLNDLTWEEDGLIDSQLSKLTDLGVRYVIYGSIVQWRVRDPYSNTEVQDASEAKVIFMINVFDLKSGEVLKSFPSDGSATGETGLIYEGDPAAFPDEGRAEDQMYQATEVALNKAADILSEILGR